MKATKIVLFALVVIAAGAGFYAYWRYSDLHPSTADAYVMADVVSIAPEQSGRVKEVAVRENQRVAAGDVLFRLDDTALADAVTQAEASQAALQATDESLSAAVTSAEEQLKSAKEVQSTAQTALERSDTLLAEGTIAQSARDEAASTLANAIASTSGAQSAFDQAKATVAQHRQQLASAAAALDQARFALSQATVTAPADGWISNISLVPGATVSAYAPLFSIVADHEWWIDANFKETDLPRIREGQPVKITIDSQPGRTFQGTVGSVSRGAGAIFSLLPPENASGNWVEVTRRFAVRIAFDDPDHSLRAGASANVRIDTTGTGSPAEAAGGD